MTGSTMATVATCLLLVRASSCGSQPMSCWQDGHELPLESCLGPQAPCVAPVARSLMCPVAPCSTPGACGYRQCGTGERCYVTSESECYCHTADGIVPMSDCLDHTGCCMPCTTCYPTNPPWCVGLPC